MLLLATACLTAAAEPPRAGQILIATAKSRDPELAKTVVLLVHAGPEGVMGLILNKPLSKDYSGGPLAIGTRSLLRARQRPKDGALIFGDVYLLPGAEKGARLYHGYVGWSEEQLASEIAAGLWTAHAPDAALAFDPHPETLWNRLATSGRSR
jgi:putative transcriptional regulator